MVVKSYIYMDIRVSKVEVYGNEKRILMNCLKLSELNKKKFGQIYYAKIGPNIIVANHFHNKKSEWLIVTEGKIKLYLVDVKSGQRKEIIMDSSNPTKIRIGPGVAHALQNISDSTAAVIEYSTEEFDSGKEDKEFFEVLK